MKQIKKWVDGVGGDRQLIFLNIAEEEEEDDFNFYGEGVVIDFNLPPTEEVKAMLKMLHPGSHLVDFIISLPEDFNPDWETGLSLARGSRNFSSYRTFNPMLGYNMISGWGE